MKNNMVRGVFLALFLFFLFPFVPRSVEAAGTTAVNSNSFLNTWNLELSWIGSYEGYVGLSNTGQYVWIHAGGTEQVGSWYSDETNIYLTDWEQGKTVKLDSSIIISGDLPWYWIGSKADTKPTKPAAPFVNQVGDASTKITGVAEAGSKVTVKSGSTVLGSATASPNGVFVISIKKQQKAGTVLTLTSVNRSKQTSYTAKATVKVEKPINPFFTNGISDVEKTLSGGTSPNCTVVVKNGSTVVGQGKSDSSGSFAIKMKSLQKANTILTVSATNSAKHTASSTVKVSKDIPKILFLSTLTDKGTQLSGTASPNTTITVKQGKTVIATGTSDAYGYFSIRLPRVQKAGATLSVFATNILGRVSAAKTITVIDTTPPSAPIVNTVGDQTKAITGKAEPGSTVTISKGYYYTIGSAKTNEKGNFSFTLPEPLAAGTYLTITATDASGNISQAVEVVVKDKTPPNAPKVNQMKKGDVRLYGTAEPSGTLTVKANGIVIATDSILALDGSFETYIGSQASGTILEITCTDRDGNVSAPTKVKVP